MTVNNAKLISLLLEVRAKLVHRAEEVARRYVYSHLGICDALATVAYFENEDEAAYVRTLISAEFAKAGKKQTPYTYLLPTYVAEGCAPGNADRIKLIDGWIKQAELRQELEVFEQAADKIENRDEAWMCNAIGNGYWDERTVLSKRAQVRLDTYKPTEHKDSGNGWFPPSVTAPKLRRLRIAILNLCIEDIKNELAAS